MCSISAVRFPCWGARVLSVPTRILPFEYVCARVFVIKYAIFLYLRGKGGREEKPHSSFVVFRRPLPSSALCNFFAPLRIWSVLYICMYMCEAASFYFIASKPGILKVMRQNICFSIRRILIDSLLLYVCARLCLRL